MKNEKHFFCYDLRDRACLSEGLQMSHCLKVERFGITAINISFTFRWRDPGGEGEKNNICRHMLMS